MNPSAIQGVEVVSDGEEGVTLRHPQRGEVQLRGVAAAVWRQADGARSVEELAAAVNAEVSSVWAALDELGDADLLSERVGPPTGIHENVRREVVFTGQANADAGTLEQQFDASAAATEKIEIPQPARDVAAREAAEDAAESAAHHDTLAALEDHLDGEAPTEAQGEDDKKSAS